MAIPLVSIIIPTYNRVAFLPRALDAVRQQSFRSWELIIIDDGSTDATRMFVQSYIPHDRRIRYVFRQHQGVYPALNSGIKRARGRYITFLGSDDRLNPSHISQRVRYLQRHPEVAMLHGGVRIIGDPYVIDKDNRNRKIHLKFCAMSGTFFGRRTVFISLGGFRVQQYGGDAAFLTQAQRRYNVRQVLWPTYIYHRDTPGSITNVQLAKNKA